MGKTIRHNRNGKEYKEKDSAGSCYHTGITNNRGMTEYKRYNSLYGKYGKRVVRFDGGYPYERDAQSDRDKGYKHVEGKLLRRGIQRETMRLIKESLDT